MNKHQADFWHSPDSDYHLIIQPKARMTMTRLCGRASGYEIGGILVGCYSTVRWEKLDSLECKDLNTAVVMEATPPPKDSVVSHDSFHRGIAGLQKLLAVRWARPDRQYYIGEWHYHPSWHVEPSDTDIKQMVQISQAKHYHCSEPIMVIAGHGNDEALSLRAFVFPHNRDMTELMRQ